MTLTETGKLCSNCNKTVIDFTNYTDRELVEFLKKANNRVCGRLNGYQVNRAISITEQNSRSLFHKLLYGSALASWLGVASSANAYGNQMKQPTEQGQKNSSSSFDDNKISFPDPIDTNSYITGTIIDYTTEMPLSNLKISVKGIHSASISDSSGYFKLFIPNSLFGKKLTLIVKSQQGKRISSECDFSSGIDNNIKIILNSSTWNYIEIHQSSIFMGDIISTIEPSPAPTIYKPDTLPHKRQEGQHPPKEQH